MVIDTEKRIFERIERALPVRYSPQGSDTEFYTNTKNISGGGLRMPLIKKVQKGTILDMEISRPNTNISIRCRGKVVWIWDTPMDTKNKELFETGIRFINPRLFYIGHLIGATAGESV